MGLRQIWQKFFTNKERTEKPVKRVAPFTGEMFTKYEGLDELRHEGWKIQHNTDLMTNNFPNWKCALKRLKTNTVNVVIRIAQVAYGTYVVFLNGRAIREPKSMGKEFRWFTSINSILALLRMKYSWKSI